MFLLQSNKALNIFLILKKMTYSNFTFKGLKVLKQHYFCDCYISQIAISKDLKYNIIDEYAFVDNLINRRLF